MSVGWGIAGYCPGPALVALGRGALGTVVFAGAMTLGMLLTDALRGSAKAKAETESADSVRHPSAAE